MHDWQVGRLCALEDAASVDTKLTIYLENACAIAHQTAGQRRVAPRIDRGQHMARRQRGKLDAPTEEEWVSGNQKRVRFVVRECREGVLDLAAVARADYIGLHADARSRFRHISQSALYNWVLRIDEYAHTRG